MSRPKQTGFTIVELLIVIVVIGILAAVVIVAYNGIQSKARLASLQATASQAMTKIQSYNVTNGSWPSTLADIGLPASSSAQLYVPYSTGYCYQVSNGALNYYVSDLQTTPAVGSCDGGTVNGAVCPSGFVPIPANTSLDAADPNGFCAMKYEAKQVGSTTTPISQASGTPWVSITQTAAIANSPNVAGCTGCHLITDAEWVAIANDVLGVASNWSGGSVGSGFIYSGHNDNSPASSLAAPTDDTDGYNGTGNTAPSNQRRTLTLSNGATIWDLAGNVWEWTTGTVAGNAQPGLSGESAYAWKQYNNGSLLWNGLSSIDQLVNVYPGAGNWSSAQGIGQLYSNLGETSARAHVRGGNWSSTGDAGVLALALSTAPSGTDASVGFRVAR